MRVSVANHLGEDAGHLALRAMCTLACRRHRVVTAQVDTTRWVVTVDPQLRSTTDPGRAEILRARSAEVVRLPGRSLVGMGSGTSEDRMLLDTLRRRGSLRRFVPFNVDAGVLSATATAIQREYSGVEINAVCGDFELGGTAPVCVLGVHDQPHARAPVPDSRVAAGR